MMDYIRTHAQSWGVKVAFLIIIVVFVFWGVGSFSSVPAGTVVMVNGTAITIDAFDSELKRAVEMQRTFQPDVSVEDLERQGIRAAVMRDMISRILIHEEAERAGITVSGAEVRAAIVSMQHLHDENGAFDRARYESYLANQRISAPAFEAYISSELLQEKIRTAITAPAALTDIELNTLFDYVAERRTLEFVRFNATDYAAEITPTPEQVEATYTTYQDFWREPARIDLQYLALTPADIARSHTPDEAAIAAYYAENESRFVIPLRAHLRHIMVAVPQGGEGGAVDTAAKEKIAAAQARLAQGADFAALARELSEDAAAQQGGDMGWITPEALDAAFAPVFSLEAGAVSEPLRSAQGYHLFKVEAIESNALLPLDEVRPAIAALVAERDSVLRLSAVAEQAQQLLASGKSLADVASELNLLVKSTGLADRERITEEVRLGAADLEMVFSLPAGTVLSEPLDSELGYLFAAITESTPEQIQPLDQVRSVVETLVVHEQSLNKAVEAATAAREQFVDGLPEAFAGKAEQGPAFVRNALDAGAGFSPDMVNAAFTAEATGVWLPGIFITQDGAVIARLHAVSAPTESERRDTMPMFKEQALAAHQQELLNLYITQLFQNAEIREHDTRILEPQVQ